MIVEKFIVYLGNLTFGSNFALSFNKCYFLEQVTKDLHAKSWVDSNVLYRGKTINCAKALKWK